MWQILRDETFSWKSHVVHEDLVDDLEMELIDRDNSLSPVFVTEPTESDFIDLPGMCMVDRAVRSVQLTSGLTVKVPSQDWASIIADIRFTKLRWFASGKGYYKLHAPWHCLVLSPDDREELIMKMEAQVEEARLEADVDNERFLRGIRAIQARGVGVASARADAIENADKPGKN